MKRYRLATCPVVGLAVLAVSTLGTAGAAHADSTSPPVITSTQKLLDGTTSVTSVPATRSAEPPSAATQIGETKQPTAVPITTPPATSGDGVVSIMSAGEPVAIDTCDYYASYAQNAVALEPASAPGHAYGHGYGEGRTHVAESEAYLNESELNIGGDYNANSRTRVGTQILVGSSAFVRADVSYPWRALGLLRASSYLTPAAGIPIIGFFLQNKSESNAQGTVYYNLWAGDFVNGQRPVNEYIVGNNGVGGSSMSINDSWQQHTYDPPVLSVPLNVGVTYASEVVALTIANATSAPGASVQANASFYNSDIPGRASLDYSRWHFQLLPGYGLSSCG